MKNWFTFTIQSSSMQDLASNTEVINFAEIPDIICIKLPDSLPRDMELSGIYDLNADKDVDFSDYVTRSEMRPWIDVQSSILDLSVGQHVYKLTFSKIGIVLTATCWFSYIVQNNHPETPYIYMTEARVESDIPKDEES